MWKKTDFVHNNNIKKLTLVLLIFITLLTHSSWFFSLAPITYGDWWFHHVESMKEWFSLPYSWDTQQNLGSFPITGMSFYGFKVLFGFFASLGIPLSISERILFFWPVAIISVFGMYYLSFKLFNNHLISFFASILYSLNTYFLLIETGHLTVAMAYSLAPLIVAFFMKSLNCEDIKSGIFTGLLFSIAFFYEPRISYIISLILFIYLLIDIIYRRITKMKVLIAIIPFALVFLIHSYWIIPYIFGGSTALNEVFATNPWISWMTILNSFSLMHPFWTGEVPTDFIVQPIQLYLFAIPLIAFSSLLFKNKDNDKIIMFFAVLGIIGIFLVKQENAPFGQVYTWLFHNFPGFNMFREASKFYFLVALSYSILLGYSANAIYEKISHFKNGNVLKNVFIIVVFIILIIPAKPAFTNELGKTFETTTVPDEYVQLKDYLHDQNDYFRTFWYPNRQRFGYYSNNHPMISGIDVLFYENGALSKFMPPNPTWVSLPENKTLNNFFDISAVKYIIIPFDSENEVYSSYLPKSNFIQNMDRFSWLNKSEFSENITIYENTGYMGHFFGIYDHNKTSLENISSIEYFDDMKKVNIEYKMINPTKYIVKINTNEQFTLAFSEAYNSNWVGTINGKEIKSFPLFSLINGFNITETGDYDLIINYKTQSYVNLGTFVSVLTLILCIGFLLLDRFMKRGRQHEAINE